MSSGGIPGLNTGWYLPWQANTMGKPTSAGYSLGESGQRYTPQQQRSLDALYPMLMGMMQQQQADIKGTLDKESHRIGVEISRLLEHKDQVIEARNQLVELLKQAKKASEKKRVKEASEKRPQ